MWYDDKQITLNKLGTLYIICNGCGERMREMGEWPVTYPKTDRTMNTLQAFRYSCMTCRTPSDKYPPGIPVMVAIIIPNGEEK